MATTLENLGRLEKALALEFARRMRQRFGSRVRDLRVFGSRARGEGDLDVWVLLDRASLQDRQILLDGPLCADSAGHR